MNRKRAFVVDDDELIRLLMVKVLEQLNLEVTCASSGDEAMVTLAQSPPFALIVLDLLLPEGTGWDVLDFLEETMPELKAPVVILSGMMLDNDEYQQLRPRVAAIVNKSTFDLEEVNNLFAKLLRLQAGKSA